MSRIAKNSIKIDKDIQCNFENGIFSAKGKLGEMLTEYLTLMDYLDQGIATATAAGKADAVEDYTKAKGNLDEVFIAIAQNADGGRQEYNPSAGP